MNKYKEKFINYCKDKIENLGVIHSKNEDLEETNKKVIMIFPKWYDTTNTRALMDFEGGLVIVDDKNNVIFSGGEMALAVYESLEMQFTKIDKNFYKEILEMWKEYGFDDILERDEIDRISREKIKKELILPSYLDYNVISRNGGADVEIYCNKIPHLGAKTTTMKNGKYVQDYFDINKLWEVTILNNFKEFERYEYVIGWKNVVKLLCEQYNKFIK